MLMVKKLIMMTIASLSPTVQRQTLSPKLSCLTTNNLNKLFTATKRGTIPRRTKQILNTNQKMMGGICSWRMLLSRHLRKARRCFTEIAIERTSIWSSTSLSMPEMEGVYGCHLWMGRETMSCFRKYHCFINGAWAQSWDTSGILQLC